MLLSDLYVQFLLSRFLVFDPTAFTRTESKLSTSRYLLFAKSQLG